MFRALFLTAAVGGLAVAAPVPKATPAPAPKTPANLTLGTATLDGTRVKITYTAPAVAAAANLPAVRPGIAQAGVRTTSVLLESVKVTKADGTELTGDDLTKKLGESPAVARSVTAIDPEWKKLFADDILFIEPNGKAAANPFGPAAPGGAVIRPLQIRPAIGRGVLPPVEEPPVEKKEEKKEEKK